MIGRFIYNLVTCVIAGSLFGSILIMLDIKFVKYIFKQLPKSKWSLLAKIPILLLDIYIVAQLAILVFMIGFIGANILFFIIF